MGRGGMDWHLAADSEADRRASPSDVRWYIIPTGHHLEWLMLLPDGMRPPDSVFRRSAAWLLTALIAEWKEDRNGCETISVR